MSWDFTDHFADVHVRFAGKGWPKDRQEAGRALAPEGVEVAWLDQIHSADVHETSVGGSIGRGDALTTDRARLALSVVTADCVPILMASGDKISAVHAGWRGVVAEVVPAAASYFPEPPRIAWIGPSISGAVYEVSDEVASQVAAVSSPEVILPGPGERPHVNLIRAVEIQLRRLAVKEIRRVSECTFSRPEFLWSYRRDGAGAGRNFALIWRH